MNIAGIRKALNGKQIEYEEGWLNDYEMHEGKREECFTVTSVDVDEKFVVVRGDVEAHVLELDDATSLIDTGVYYDSRMLYAGAPMIAYQKYTLKGGEQ